MIASSSTSSEHVGQAMHDLATDLFPICRSVTGPGVRQTLQRLQEIIPLQICEVPTGTQVFDWTVPREWSIRDAYVLDEQGRRVIDFAKHNLHVVNGSTPVDVTTRWSELRPRLHTLPEHPDWIPYRTCFHTEDWGFCLTQRTYDELERRGERTYQVRIDSQLKDGSLTFGELLLPGECQEEVLISTHVCHPSLANDNLSGIVVATYLAARLRQRHRRCSYRFLFIPATIGAITWLSLNRHHVSTIRHGWVMSVVGDRGGFTYKKSRRGDADIDRAFVHALQQSTADFKVLDFEPFGYDQRQFCSPAFDLPIGCLMRSANGSFPEYHTSADNLDFISPQSLAGSLELCERVCQVLDGNAFYRNLHPWCEPRLGPRGLYHAFGRHPAGADLQRAVLWVLNQSDGRHDLLDIAERAQLPFALIHDAAELLVQNELLERIDLEPEAMRPLSDAGSSMYFDTAAAHEPLTETT